MKDKNVINASGVGEYIYCPRAWALHQLGYTPSNQKALDAGTAYHRNYGAEKRRLRKLMKVLVWLLLLLIAVLAVLILRQRGLL